MRKILSIFLCFAMLIGYIPTGVAMADEESAGSNADLSSLTVAGSVYYDLTPAFDAGTTTYAVDVPNDVSSVEVTATTADSSATMKINGTAAAGGSAVTVDNLAVGENPVAVEVTAADNTTVKTYTIAINRADAAAANPLPQTPAAYAASDYAKYSSRMATGYAHIAVINANGTLVMGGDNTYGQCDIPADLAGVKVKAVAAGYYHTLALTEDNRVFAWGSMKDDPQSVPDEAAAAQGHIKLIAAGGHMSAVVTDDDKVIVWGDNACNMSDVPEGLSNIAAIAIGGNCAVVLNDAGEVTVWGNSYCKPVPYGLNGNVVAIAAGMCHWLALSKDGTVSITGRTNMVNQCIKMADRTDVRAIVGGSSFGGAILADGSVMGWGMTMLGSYIDGIELVPASAQVKAFTCTVEQGIGSRPAICAMQGDGAIKIVALAEFVTTPVTDKFNFLTAAADNADLSSLVVTNYDINPTFDAANTAYTVNVLNDTTSVEIIAVTDDSNASLEINEVNATSGVAQAINNLIVGDNPVAVEVTAADGTTVKTYTLTIKRAGSGGLPQTPAEYAASDYAKYGSRLASGGGHAAVVLADGTVNAWGDNTYGQLEVPAGATGVKTLAAGTSHTLALKEDGTVVAWGFNGYGQCNLPAELEGTKFKAVAATTTGHISAVLSADNRIGVRGLNNYNQTLISQILVSDKTLMSIAMDTRYVLALCDDGTVKAWDWRDSFSPCEAPAGFSGEVVALEAGNRHILALKADGSVVSWGHDGYDYDVPAGLINVRAIGAGYDYSVALTADGNITVWGQNSYNLDTIPADLGQVKALAAGNRNLYVLREDGTIAAWGDNSYGQCDVPAGLNLFSMVSNDSRLAGLSVATGDGTACGVYPAFSCEQSEFVADVAYEIREVRVTAQLFSGKAGLVINGEPAAAGVATVINAQNLAVGDNPVQIKVTAESGQERSYTLHIKRVEAGYSLPQTPRAYRESQVAAFGRRMAAGSQHSLVIKNDGKVAAWGSNMYGECNVPVYLDNIIAVAGGSRHSLVLQADGKVTAVGIETEGQYKVPNYLSDVVDISAGTNLLAALTADGKVFAWGNNTSGQCDIPTELNDVVDIECGEAYTLALRSDGTVKAWGRNDYGQCDVPADLDSVVAIAAGPVRSMALKADGTLVTWGKYQYSGIDFEHPDLQYVKAITVGDCFAAALKWDGSLVVWGDDFGKNTDITIPLSLDQEILAICSGDGYLLGLNEDGTVDAWKSAQSYAPDAGQCDIPSGLNLFTSDTPYEGEHPDIPQTPQDYAASDYARAYAKIRNVSSQANDGIAVLNIDSTVKVILPVCERNDDVYGLRKVPEGLSNVTAIATTGGCLGNFNIMALTGEGKVEVWGYNGDYQCKVPADLVDVTAIAMGCSSAPCCLALQADGTVKAWGGNVYGQCNVPADLTDVTAVAAGGKHCLALKEDGTVVAWGNNDYGQCDVPSGLKNVARIYANHEYSLALKEDGTVVAWGSNLSPSHEFYCGQCDVPEGLSGVVDIALSSYGCAALKSNGTVVAWGDNVYGLRNVPAGLHDVAAVSFGSDGCGVVAVKTDGSMVLWGSSPKFDKESLTDLGNVLTLYGGEDGNTVIFRDGTLYCANDEINAGLAGLNVLSGYYFAVNKAELLNPVDGRPITSVPSQGGYRIQARVANNNTAPTPGLAIIQVRGGSGATSAGGGRVLGCVGLSGEIPVTGSTVSSDFTMPAGLSGKAYVDVFVWDGWDTMVPRAKAYQRLNFNVTQ